MPDALQSLITSLVRATWQSQSGAGGLEGLEREPQTGNPKNFPVKSICRVDAIYAKALIE